MIRDLEGPGWNIGAFPSPVSFCVGTTNPSSSVLCQQEASHRQRQRGDICHLYVTVR